MEHPDYVFDESDIVGIPMPPPKAPKAKKEDKRTKTSKANIVKALEAKKRQKADEYEIEELSESSEADTESEEYVPKKQPRGIRSKKAPLKEPKPEKNLYTEQQMQELRHIVTALAKAQKKSARQKKKTIIQVPPQPAPTAVQPKEEKKDPAKDMLKNSILRF